MKRLENKIAVITGGTTGIGFATAKKFLAEGAIVAVFARKRDELDKAVSQLGKGCFAYQGDVTKQEDIEKLYSDVHKQFGRLDIIFANAGQGEFTLLDEATDEHFDRMFNVNTKGVFFTVQRALPYLTEGASIIINASISGIKGFERLEAYSASKAAARSLARTLSADLVKREIRVNSVSPGLIDTPIHPKMGAAGEDVREGAKQAIPLGRVGTPDDIANAVAFLASDEASYIVGIELIVDGGLTQI
jgi:NAD(P)-dependent dehydrogenase (short-subunit alcohol dehydrogenase family)